MVDHSTDRDELLRENEQLRVRLQEAEETLEAIRVGGVDALVVVSDEGDERVFTLEGADRVYRVFLESVGQGALTLDHQGVILYANSAAAALFGADPRTLPGSNLQSQVRREDRSRFRALLEASRGAPVSVEVRMRGPKGGRPVLLSLHNIEESERLAAILTDLTEQKKSEEMLEAERLARSILEQAGEAIIVCDEKGRIVRASRAALKLAGTDPLFKRFDSVLPLKTPDGKTRVLQWRGGDLLVRGEEVTFRRPDDHVFRLVLNADRLSGGDHAFLGTIVTLADVTQLAQAQDETLRLLKESRRANRELAAIETLSASGLKLANVDQLTHSIASQLVATMEADEATLLLNREQELELVACVPPLSKRRHSLHVGSGLAGTVAALKRTLFVQDVHSSRLVHGSEVRRGVRSMLGTPLLDGERVLGVLHVGWHERHETDVHEQRFIEIVADRVATAIQSQLLMDQLAATLSELQVHNDELVISREALKASEEKYRAIVETAGEGIAIVDRNGRFTYVNDRMAEMLGEAPETILSKTRYDFTFDEDRQTDRPTSELVWSGEMHGEMRLRRSDGSELWTYFNATPLSDKGDARGDTLVLHTDITDRKRVEVERQRLLEEVQDQQEELQTQNEELAEQASQLVALNAELRESEKGQRTIAVTLQQNFMHELPKIRGLEIAALMEPAGALELIGGDFHDVVELADGTVSVLIGDVEGKGARAAGLTETVRAAVRALSTVSPSARYCLNHVNRMLLAEGSPQFVTALMMMIDPATGEVLLASAGHPPPVLIDAGGPHILEPSFGPPLGTFEWDYAQLALTLEPGSTLVAYTDGLTEARRGTSLFLEQRLLETVERNREAAPEDIIDALKSAALDWADQLRDDLQIIAVRFTGIESRLKTEHSLRLAVPHVPSYLGDVRGSVRDFLAAHGIDTRTIERMVLCIEEACTNTLRHSRDSEPAQLSLWLEDGMVAARVTDVGVGFDLDGIDLSAPPEPMAPGGRGLYLINQIADELEVTCDRGTSVTVRVHPGQMGSGED